MKLLSRVGAEPAAADDSEPGFDLPRNGEAVNGVAAIRRLAESLAGWADRPDVEWVASFNSRCIEKFGNGGGNFRRLYAGFLTWARALDERLVPESAPALATQAADGWTTLSVLLGDAARGEAGADVWQDAAAEAERIADTEHALFTQLAEAAG